MNETTETGQIPEAQNGKPTIDPAETRARVEAARTRRQDRLKRRKQQQTTRMLQMAVVVVLVALVGVLGLRFARVIVPTRTLAETTAAAAGESTADDTQAETAAELAVASAEGDPTPLFAKYRSLFLYLPVRGELLSEIAFHQASGDHALHMECLIPDADMTAAHQNHGTGRTAEDACAEKEYVLGGEALRMWRSGRSGKPDSAVDVGASPGTPVFAPVSGEVLAVRPYKLYGEHDDYEVHITPEGWPEVDVVLIHIDYIPVKAGDRVVGGVTQIGTVRHLSEKVSLQLAQFDEYGGNHTHMQLNKLDVPGQLPDPEGQ